MGTLFIIATPIGNREDLSIRAIKTLGSVDVLLCEDTRRTGQLIAYIAELIEHRPWNIDHFEFKKPKLISYQEHNELERIPEVVTLLLEGRNVGLVSDAGTPLISDPGFKLVRECIKQGINVVSIPGPTAVISALVSSGLPTDKFLFLGYLPKQPGKRKELLTKITTLLYSIKVPIVLYESPFRLQQTLKDVKETLGDVEVVVARELTKMHEEVWRGKVSEATSHFQNPRGEFTVLLNL